MLTVTESDPVSYHLLIVRIILWRNVLRFPPLHARGPHSRLLIETTIDSTIVLQVARWYTHRL